MTGLRVALALLLGVLACAAGAQQTRVASGARIEARATWAPETLGLLDTLTLTISVQREAGAVLRIAEPLAQAGDPASEDELLGPMLGDFMVRSQRIAPPARKDDGSIVESWTLELEPFVPGVASIPPLSFSIDGGGTAALGRIDIEVVSVAPADAAAQLDVGPLSEPLEPPEPSRFPWGGVLLLTILAMLAVLLGVLGYAVLRSLRQPPALFEQAFMRINEQRSLVEQDASQQTLRQAWRTTAESMARCIAERLEPQALRLAFDELGRRADSWFGLTERDRAELRELLTEMDAVRYADAPIDRSGTLVMLKRSERLLERVRAASELVVDDAAQDAEDGA